MKKNLLTTIFNGLALAMGVATLVLNILGVLDNQTAFTLLGLGMFALAAANLQKS